jgi:hypothetical protein
LDLYNRGNNIRLYNKYSLMPVRKIIIENLHDDVGVVVGGGID